MNKKYIAFSFMALFAMAIVSAGLINYYGTVETTISVNQPIEVNGEVGGVSTDELSCDAGETCSGSEFVISNNGDDERTVGVENNATENEVAVSYMGELVLTQKDAEWQPTDEKMTITYTVVGDSFEVSGVEEGYTVIYYKDAVVGIDGRLDNPQPAIAITGDMGNLPQVDDANADTEADYCNNDVDNYDSCRGAKLWVVPTSDVNDGVLTWANMANYYYETNLIQYNTDGEIIVYGESELALTPEYTLASGLNEDPQVVVTNVNVA